MIIHNPILTGSFTYNGADISNVLSSSANTTSLNAATASLNTFSASVLTFTGSVNTFTGSADSRLSSLEAATASLYTATSSFSTRVGALESYTSSQDIRNTTYATTGSNTLVGTQYISNTNDAVGFSATTSSIYTDGGLQVTKNAYFSSSMFVKGNLTVYGTQSVSFITSSQLNISTNLITVNTSTPSVRFGGLAVYDSGSTGLTGSILWDSQNNHWIYTNPSGSSYSGGMLISGPRNTGSIGDEQGTTSNALMKGMGGDHITSSQITDDGTTVKIPGVLQVTGSIIGSSTLSATSITATGTITSVGSSPVFRNTDNSVGNEFDVLWSVGGSYWAYGVAGFYDATNSQKYDEYKGGASGFRKLYTNGTLALTIASTGNVGIGTTTPQRTLCIANGGANVEIDAAGGTAGPIYFNYNRSTSTYLTPEYWALGHKFMVNGGTLALTLASTGAATFNSSVGIGVAPDFPLTIKTDASANSIKIIGRSGGDSLLAFYASNGTTPYLDFSAGATYVNYNAVNSQNYNWYCNSSLKMVLTSGGNVGIGTSSPQAKFVISNAGAEGFEFIPADSSNYNRLQSYSRSGGVYNTLETRASTHIWAIDATEKMRITSGGNVGIGTSSPTAKLEITNGRVLLNNGYSYQFINTAGSAVDTLQMFTDGNVYLDAKDSTGGNLIFRTSNSITERMRITSGGNVLIGTTTDNTGKLQVNGEIRMYGSTLFRGMSSNTLQLCGGTSSSNVLIDGASEVITMSTNGGERLRITNTGAICSNTTTPFYDGAGAINTKVTATSIFMISGQNTNNSNPRGIFLDHPNTTGDYSIYYKSGGAEKFYVNGNGVIYSTSNSITLISSDVNLKTDIKDYDKGLAEVLAMKPRYFKYKDNLEEQKIGFIAQEMEQALAGSMIDVPTGLDTGEFHKSYQIDWYPLLVKAIQELKAEFDDYKSTHP